MNPTLTRLGALMALVAASSQLAQAQTTYEFRAPKKGLAVSASSNTPAPAPSPSPAPAPAPTYLAETSSGKLTFGAVPVGQFDTAQVLLSNIGTGVLSLGAPQVSGAGFSASTACGATLAPGASCLTDVTFSPLVAGAASGSLSLPSNASGSPLVVTLSGNAVQAEGSLAASTSTAFGTVQVGASASRSFTFTNIGTMAATGVQASLSNVPGLTLSANSCGTAAQPVTLDANQSCSMTVAWSPAAAGSLSATLSVASSAVNSPASLALDGTAALATGSLVANTSASYGTVYVDDAASRVFTFTNTGAGALTGISASVAGTGYSLSANTCGTAGSPVSLAAGATCSMTVALAPVVEGSHPGTLTVASSASNAPHTLSLSASAAYSTPDAYLNSVSLLFNAEGGTSTAPVNAKGSMSLAAVGTPLLATNDKRYGLRSGYLNGTSVFKATGAASGFGTGDFTVEGWFKYTGTYSSSTYMGFVGTDTTGGLTFYIGSNAIRYAPQNSSSVVIAGLTGLQSNTWQHIAVQRQSGTLRVFINGSSVGSISATNNFPAQTFVIGGDTPSAGRFTGYVDDVRVTPGVARYPAAGFTPGPAPSM